MVSKLVLIALADKAPFPPPEPASSHQFNPLAPLTTANGWQLPQFVELPSIEVQSKARAPSAPESLSDVDVRELLLQCLLIMGLFVSETDQICQTLSWPEGCEGRQNNRLRLMLAVARDAHGRTVLHAAALNGFDKLATALIQADGELQLMGVCDNDNRTCLHSACQGGNELIVEILLKHGAAVDACDAANTTPLHIAAADAPTKCVQSLLDRGAECQALGDSSGTALHWACAAGRSDVAQVLLEASTGLIGMHGGAGNTALVMAVVRAAAATVGVLIQVGADILEQVDIGERGSAGMLQKKNADNQDCVQALLAAPTGQQASGNTERARRFSRFYCSICRAHCRCKFHLSSVCREGNEHNGACTYCRDGQL